MSSPALRTGQVIFLNGTSSSGKSSIAEQLMLVLKRPFFHMSVDAIYGMRAPERSLELGPDALAAVLARSRAGFHRAVAGMAQAANDLVVDYVLRTAVITAREPPSEGACAGLRLSGPRIAASRRQTIMR